MFLLKPSVEKFSASKSHPQSLANGSLPSSKPTVTSRVFSHPHHPISLFPPHSGTLVITWGPPGKSRITFLLYIQLMRTLNFIQTLNSPLLHDITHPQFPTLDMGTGGGRVGGAIILPPSPSYLVTGEEPTTNLFENRIMAIVSCSGCKRNQKGDGPHQRERVPQVMQSSLQSISSLKLACGPRFRSLSNMSLCDPQNTDLSGPASWLTNN